MQRGYRFHSETALHSPAVKSFTVPTKDIVNRFTGKRIYDKMSDEIVITSPLVELRERAGLTQESLAQLLGVTDHTVRNWEKGRAEARLTLRQFKILCVALKVSADELPDSFSPDDRTLN